MKLKHKLLIVSVMVAFFTHDMMAQTKSKAIKKPVVAAVKTPPLATAQDIEAGKALIAKSDCLACHHPENKLVGPTYLSVAEKYPLTAANISMLSQKIIAGGSGNWGTVPMPPHVGLSVDDAGKMVKYILSIKAATSAN